MSLWAGSDEWTYWTRRLHELGGWTLANCDVIAQEIKEDTMKNEPNKTTQAANLKDTYPPHKGAPKSKGKKKGMKGKACLIGLLLLCGLGIAQAQSRLSTQPVAAAAGTQTIVINFVPPVMAAQMEVAATGPNPSWTWQTSRGSIDGADLDGDGPWGIGTNEYHSPKIISVTLVNCTVSANLQAN